MASSWLNSSLWSRRGRRAGQDQEQQLDNLGNTNDANANAANGANGAQAAKDKKSGEPLFGPSIGAVSSGPSWTLSNEKKIVTDELTPEIVSGWIEKSKEPSHPTTTLQALVNLKRPTLRLSPLAADEANPDQQHGLEFEYDCDAPKCGIYVHVHLPKNHPDAPSTSSHSALAKLQVFDIVVDGGFGNRLTLEEGAILDLDHFEATDIQVEKEKSEAPGEPSATGNLSQTPSTTDVNSTTRPSATPNNSGSHRRRFTQFHFRKRSQNRVAGPALAVVDAEPAAAATPENGKPAKDSKEEEGVKVTIRLAALDEAGTELVSPNEQVTYLHIVRFGQKPAQPEPVAGSEPAPEPADTRPWVVRVVKREATIGPHTFHLHEIYGLTSSSSHGASATAPPPAALPHTYPPEESDQANAQAEEEDPQSECLLCLSSPREVVLLPCRHLVACKECALNMVEFGAGGNITQASEPSAGGDEVVAPSDLGATAPGTAGGPTSPGTPGTPAVTANTRRKRKAKGWFCPVCRQPYTSMLRLTTTAPPPPELTKDADGSGSEDEGEGGLEVDLGTATPQTTEVSQNQRPGTANSNAASLLSGLRPGFLRGLSSRGTAADVENQATARA